MLGWMFIRFVTNSVEDMFARKSLLLYARSVCVRAYVCE